MRKFLPVILALFYGGLLFIFSCNKDNDFDEDDTFTLDTLVVEPATINNAFALGWKVTTTGYPQFFIDFYLSDDEFLTKTEDLEIGSTSSIDIASDDSLDEEQYFMVEQVPGTDQVRFLHNEKTSDPADDRWAVSDPITILQGEKKYIIADCYHTPGLIIIVGRTRMAVEVTFQ